MVATVLASEDQVAAVVRSCCVLSLYLPIAANAGFLPSGTEALAGVTEIELSVAELTVSGTLTCNGPIVALIKLVPIAAFAVSSPLESMEAMF
jgi:hypothetical protein